MQFSQPHVRSKRAGIQAIIEVLGVFVVGSLLANIVMGLVGFTQNPLNQLATDPNANRYLLAVDLAGLLLIQYAGWLLLAIGFGLWQKRRLINAAGLSAQHQSLAKLIALGIVAIAFAGLPLSILNILDKAYDLGTTVPWREAAFNADWDGGFWLLMFVGSFGLIPFLEELFFRGYMQSRLQHSLPPSLAILLTSIVFTLSHSQYHQLDVYNMATIAGVFLSSVVMGYVFQQTGSLIPAITMHTILNVPVDGVYQLILMCSMIGVIVIKQGAIRTEIKAFFKAITSVPCSPTNIATLLIATGFMLTLSFLQSTALVIGGVMFLASIILTFINRRNVTHDV